MAIEFTMSIFKDTNLVKVKRVLNNMTAKQASKYMNKVWYDGKPKGAFQIFA